MKNTRFTFLTDETERDVLRRLAANLQRSQSDAVRWLIRNAAQEMERRAACEGHYQHDKATT